VDNSPPIYDIRNLVQEREKAGARFTLHVPDFQVHAGEFIAVIGESGCGKSTLLDLLGFILRPTHCDRFAFRRAGGSIVELGVNAGQSTLATLRRSEIGYVLQQGGLLPFLTVRQNIELPQRINGIRDGTLVHHLLRKLNIEDQRNKLPQHLSGGQRQRVAIARALVHQPPVILSDEPTAAVDELTARDILEHFRSLVRELGVTLVLVTHNLSLVRQAADRFFNFEITRHDENTVVSTCHECDAPS
jgi:putative ABC transport system ATP-binding protein